jgi:hypothetical protein
MADRVGRPEVFGVQPERWFSYQWLHYIIFARQVKLDWQERAAARQKETKGTKKN